MRITGICFAVHLLAAAPAANAQPTTADRTSRVVSEVIGGGLGAVAGGIALGFVGSRTIGPQDGEDPGLLGAVLGTVVGVTVGSSAGVYLGSRPGQVPTRYTDALGGSALGMAAFLFLRPALGLDPDHAPFWFGLIGAPVAGGVLLQEVGLRNRGVRLQLAPRRDGIRIGARIEL